ncbi:lipopolysaccharide biosynthesis protein [Vibrio cyclitrophicus]
MNKKIKKYFLDTESSNVFKGMITLFVGAGFARIIGLVSIPILSRIYSPESYGVLAIYVSLVSVLAPIMTLRYVQAIPLPKRDLMAFNLLSVCFKLIILFSLILILILYIWGETILMRFNMEALIPWQWLIVLGVFGTALYELLSSWATRKRQYKVIAKTQITQSLIGNLIKISLGLLAFKSSGMLIGQLVSQSAGVTSIIKHCREDFKLYLTKVSLTKEKLVAKYYQDFVWFRLPSQFLMVISTQAPVIMMASLFDTNSVGQYGLAKMVLMVPSALIGQAVSRAFYAEIARIGKSDFKKIKIITWDVQKKLIMVGAPIMIIFSTFAPWFFVVFFGNEWVVAGEYARILSPYILLILISTPLIQVLNIVGSQSVFLMINITRALGLIFLFFLVDYFKLTAVDFIIVFSVFSSIYAVFQLVIVFYYVNRAAKLEPK